MIRSHLIGFLNIATAMLLFTCSSAASYISSSKNPYPQIEWGGHDYVFISDMLAQNNVSLQNGIIGTVARNIMANIHTTSLRRELEDFDAFNSLLEGLVLKLPDINDITAGSFLGLDLILWARNMKCFDVSIGDIIIDHGSFGTQEYDLSIEIIDLAMSCDLDWRYAYSIFTGEGSAQVYTTKSDAGVTLTFKSVNFDLHPPSEVDATKCSATIEIDKLDLQGGIVSSIANMFKESLADTIENAINDMVCGELMSLGEDFLGQALELVRAYLENIISDELPPEDYLYAEKDLLASVTLISLLDFSNFEVQALLKLVNSFLGEKTKDPNLPTFVDLRINSLLRNIVLDNDRALSVTFDDLVIFDSHDLLTETIIELDRIKLYGLDTMDTLDVLQSAGKYTMLNHFSWQFLSVALDFTITIKPSDKDNSVIGTPSVEEVVEQMTITAGINDVDADFHFLLAVDNDKLGGIELGSLTELSNILPCILDTFYQVEVTGFSVNATAIDNPSLSGFVSPGIDRVMSGVSDAVFSMYEASVIKVLPTIFQVTLKKAINELLQKFIASSDKNCQKKEFPSNETFINFGDLLLSEEEAVNVGGTGLSQYGHIFRDAMSLVQDELINVYLSDGRAYLNDILISKLTQKQSSIPGCLKFPSEYGTKFSLELGEFVADMELKLSNATIRNIDTISSPLNLLDPISPQALNNTLAIGVGNKPLQGGVVLTFGLNDGKNIRMRNEIELSMDLGGIMNAAAHMSILENTLMKFPIEDITNIDCWLSIIPAPKLDTKGVRIGPSDATLALRELSFAISSLQLNVKCISCTSPLFEDLTSILSSPDATSELTDLIHKAVNSIANLLGGTLFSLQIDRILVDAAKKCPHSVSYVGEEFSKGEYESFEYQKQPNDPLGFVIAVAATIVACCLIALTAAYFVNILKRNRLNLWIATLSDTEVAILLEKQEIQRERQSRLNFRTKAMFMSQSIPCIMRFLVPLIVVGNIAFFLSGHLSLGATVDIDVVVAGEAFRINELFSFSMVGSIQQMWDAGAKELAVLIICVSGLWPYTKQFLVLILWFTPPTLCSVSRRESIIIWLDILGKWSFLDIFVLILSISSFRVMVQSPVDASYLPTDFLKMDLLVIPRWGLYANMTAQFISQFNSHLIIHYHRKIKSDFEEEEALDKSDIYTTQSEDDVPSRLHQHSFRGSRMKRPKHWTVRRVTNFILIGLSVSFVTLLICGCTLPSYSLEQYGLVGLVSSVPYVKHDIFSTAKLLLDQAKSTGALGDHIGLSILSAVMILTVVIIPILQMALLLIRWFVPLKERSRFRLFAAIEALAAWQYVEVYLISIMVASWQLGDVSTYLINDYCGGLEETFATMQYYGVLSVNDAQCFRVSAKLESATWILISAAVLLALINHIVGSASAHQEADLNTKEDARIDSTFGGKTNVDSAKTMLKRRQTLQLESARFTDYYRCLLKIQLPPVEELSLS